MDLISGPGSAPFCRESQLSNASKDGMNGWTRVSKKLNGQEVKIKNYCNSLVSFQVSGVPLLLLLVEHPHNAMKDMKNYSTWRKERVLNRVRT